MHRCPLNWQEGMSNAIEIGIQRRQRCFDQAEILTMSATFREYQ